MQRNIFWASRPRGTRTLVAMRGGATSAVATGTAEGPIHFAFRAKHGSVPLPFFHRKWREAHGRGEVVPSAAATATSFFYAGVTSSK